MPLPPEFLLLLPVAVAAGADLYLTLLVSGLYLFLGENVLGAPAPLPAGSWALLPGLAGLYILEATAELWPVPALFWHGLQLLLRPLGGALLGASLMGDGAPALALTGAFVAGLVAAFTHVHTWGQGLLLRLVPERHVSPVTLNFSVDTLALALLVLAWEQPTLGFALALLLLLLGLFMGSHYHRVVRFGTLLLRDRVWGFLYPAGWTEADKLPRWVRGGSPDGSPEGLRGVRAGARRLPGGGKFREGWLLDRAGALFFLYKKESGFVEVPLDDFPLEPEEIMPLAVRVPLAPAAPASPALFLQRSGPGLKTHKWRKNL